jgi:hypothetical protein
MMPSVNKELVGDRWRNAGNDDGRLIDRRATKILRADPTELSAQLPERLFGPEKNPNMEDSGTAQGRFRVLYRDKCVPADRGTPSKRVQSFLGDSTCGAAIGVTARRYQ